MKIVQISNGRGNCPSCGKNVRARLEAQQLDWHYAWGNVCPGAKQKFEFTGKYGSTPRDSSGDLLQELDLSAVKKNSFGKHRAKVIGAMNMPLPAKIPGEMTIWVQKADKGQCVHILVGEPRVIGGSIRNLAVKPP